MPGTRRKQFHSLNLHLCSVWNEVASFLHDAKKRIVAWLVAIPSCKVDKKGPWGMLGNLADDWSSSLYFIHVHILLQASFARPRVSDLPFVVSVAILKRQQLIKDMIGMINSKPGHEACQNLLQSRTMLFHTRLCMGGDELQQTCYRVIACNPKGGVLQSIRHSIHEETALLSSLQGPLMLPFLAMNVMAFCIKLKYLEAALKEGAWLGGCHAGSHLVDKAEELVGGYRLEGSLHPLVDLPLCCKVEPQLHDPECGWHVV